MYSLSAVLYHLIAGRPPFDATQQAAIMHQIYNAEPPPLKTLREGVSDGLHALIHRGLSKDREQRFADWDELRPGLSDLVTNQAVPRGPLQEVLDSERFNLLRTLDFFRGFGDVELWEVVHRAQWQRLGFGHAIYRKGDEGNSFHILAQGQIEVYRDGQRVAQLGAGTSVGEMAYLAPSPDCACTAPSAGHRAVDHDQLHARGDGTPEPQHPPPVRRRLHPRAGAAAARRARATGASAQDPVAKVCCGVQTALCEHRGLAGRGQVGPKPWPWTRHLQPQHASPAQESVRCSAGTHDTARSAQAAHRIRHARGQGEEYLGGTRQALTPATRQKARPGADACSQLLSSSRRRVMAEATVATPNNALSPIHHVGIFAPSVRSARAATRGAITPSASAAAVDTQSRSFFAEPTANRATSESIVVAVANTDRSGDCPSRRTGQVIPTDTTQATEKAASSHLVRVDTLSTMTGALLRANGADWN
jgi:hypothetical protein